MLLKTYSLQQNQLEVFGHALFPITFQVWQNRVIDLPDTGTHFGYTYQGLASLTVPAKAEAYPLHPGMYFCLPGKGSIGGKETSGIVITHPSYRGMFSLGGPIETQGRFAYIDGGTSSLLIPPVLRGDPCLNAMYFPPATEQTSHTHPSDRLGVVVEGQGECKTPQETAHLQPGIIFWIPANSLHQFCTKDNKLTVVVFHPDSDTGFTHQDNPMLNRTLVGEVSAAELPQIQTKMTSDRPKANT
ncbi:MAG: cupin domain-containing protein [Leptolyngbyaceae cyanobacterium SL_5_9]|nr:cupin domain-containing protein [Leptolyngbyaceae cyanobacterium SL_5_9]